MAQESLDPAFILYHNPRCSKSRGALALLEERGIRATVVPYLEQPLTADEIQSLVVKLGLSSVRQLMRTGEDLYRELALADVTDEAALRQAMAENPKLMERPVLVHGHRAVIGRPPENVLALIAP